VRQAGSCGRCLLWSPQQLRSNSGRLGLGGPQPRFDLLWVWATAPQPPIRGRRSSWSCPTHAAPAHLRAVAAGGDRPGWVAPGEPQRRPLLLQAAWRAPRRHHRSFCLVAWAGLSWGASLEMERAGTACGTLLDPLQPCSMAPLRPPSPSTHLETRRPCRPARSVSSSPGWCCEWGWGPPTGSSAPAPSLCWPCSTRPGGFDPGRSASRLERAASRVPAGNPGKRAKDPLGSMQRELGEKPLQPRRWDSLGLMLPGRLPPTS